MKTISVSNQKGGCGKTTTSVNLAGALASLGKTVLVIDFDPQSHASFGLGITNQAADASIYNALTDNPEKRRNIADCIVHVSQNLDLVPSSILLSTLEQELKDKEDAVSRLYQALSNMNLNYDYVIIDCPPSLGFLTFNSLRAAELVIVPIDMSAFSLMGVGKLLGMLELIQLKINHAPRVKGLATIFDKRTKYSQTMLDEIRAFFKDQMFETVIRISVALKKAAFAGVPVIALDNEANGSIDHLALAKEVMTLNGDLEFERAMAEVSKDENELMPQAARAKSVLIPVEVPAQQAQFIPERAQQTRISTVTSSTERPESRNKDISDKVEFRIEMPSANEVYVVGEFNHWKINDSSRLSRNNDGSWQIMVPLSPGTYRYKFVVDGQWVLDGKNTDREQNPFGTFDSVLKVK